MSYNIYVIEDDANIQELLEVALKSYGYNVLLFEKAEDAFENINKIIPQLIICDIMLPAMNGIEAVSKIRREKRLKFIPIIMLTAKDSEIDKIKGLEAGADDYVTKPFSIMELMARVRSQFRKLDEINLSFNTKMEKIIIGEITLNITLREVEINKEKVKLTYKEFELLKYLIQNENKPISREEILNKIWSYDYIGETRTVDIHIKTLRKKHKLLEQYIKTIRGIGYKISI